jgi:hypothetical protein
LLGAAALYLLNAITSPRRGPRNLRYSLRTASGYEADNRSTDHGAEDEPQRLGAIAGFEDGVAEIGELAAEHDAGSVQVVHHEDRGGVGHRHISLQSSLAGASPHEERGGIGTRYSPYR